MKSFLAPLIAFFWGLSVLLIFFTGKDLKAIYTYVSYYDDFLNHISQSRFNTSDTARTLLPGVVRRADTARWYSPYKNESCVLSHTAIMADIECICSRCACEDRRVFLVNQLRGPSLWFESGDRKFFLPDTLRMVRFVTDGEYWLDEPILTEIPETLLGLEMRDVSFDQHERMRYRVHESTVKNGDSICLNGQIDKQDNIIEKGYTQVMLGGFAPVRDRLAFMRQKHRTRFNDQLVWVVLSVGLFAVGAVLSRFFRFETTPKSKA